MERLPASETFMLPVSFRFFVVMKGMSMRFCAEIQRTCYFYMHISFGVRGLHLITLWPYLIWSVILVQHAQSPLELSWLFLQRPCCIESCSNAAVSVLQKKLQKAVKYQAQPAFAEQPQTHRHMGFFFLLDFSWRSHERETLILRHRKQAWHQTSPDSQTEEYKTFQHKHPHLFPSTTETTDGYFIFLMECTRVEVLLACAFAVADQKKLWREKER